MTALLIVVIWAALCTSILIWLAGTHRGKTESEYSPDELRRVRDFARDDTH